MAEEKKVEIPKKFEKIVEEIEKMSVLDLSELVKVLEDKFGVSSMPAMAMPSVPVAEGEEKEEKSTFNVVLKDAGASKIPVIKVLKETIEGLGLKEAKEIADNTPKTIKEGVKKEEAEEMKKKLEEAGAVVELN